MVPRHSVTLQSTFDSGIRLDAGVRFVPYGLHPRQVDFDEMVDVACWSDGVHGQLPSEERQVHGKRFEKIDKDHGCGLD